MAFSIFKVLKGLLITEENTLTPKEIEIVPGGTASTKTVIQSSQTTNKTITLPDATDTLVGKATTDTLTNKSIDADTNTITNIEDADIKALAAIDATKIADGSVTSAEFQYLSGVTSDIQTQINTNATAISDHLTDTTDAHDASAISSVPAGNLAATDVQAALDELQSDVDSRLSLSGGTMTGNIDLDNNALSNVPTPTNADHAANKEYVDSLAAGLDPKSACRVATTADLAATYATTPSNGQFTSAPSTIDSISLNIGDRVLVKDQTDAKENGIYVYTAANELTRSTDMDGSPASEVSAGNFTFIAQGTVNESKGFLILGDGILTLNTDDINWSQFSGATNTALRDLSNLTSPTAINQHLLPDVDLTRTLGDDTHSWLRANIASIYDTSGNVSTSLTGRELYDSTGNTSIQWESRLLRNSSNNLVLDYSGTNPSIQSKKLIDVADAELNTDAVNRQSLNRAVKNYIANHDAILDTTGYAAYADAAATSPVDGTGGSPNITITRSTSSPLRGVASFLITKDAANRQGQGISYDFTIDSADKGKVLQGSFDYVIASGTYVDDDMSVWIYDVTNARLIQPAPYLLKNHSLPSERIPFEFQTAIDSTSYRLIIHQASTSTSAYTIKFDNVSVGPQAKLYGSAVTDWQSYTPSNTTGFGTISAVNLKWRKVGDSIEIQGGFTSGTMTGSNAELGLPPGLTIGGTTGARIHVGNLTRPSAAGPYTVLGVQGRTYLTFGSGGSSQGDIPGTSLLGNNEVVLLTGIVIPIQGWSSSQIMSQDASTRVIGFRANNSSTTINATPAKVVWTNTDRDDVGGYSSGTYTVKVPGWYDVDASLYQASTPTVDQTMSIAIYRNGASIKAFTHRYKVASATSTSISIRDRYYFNTNDTIEIYTANEGTTPSISSSTTLNTLAITLVSGPAQVLSSESVTASYRISSDKTPSASNPIDFDTKIFDSHNAVTTGSSWKFTAPMSGTYQLSLTTYTTTTGGTLDIYVSGVQDRGLHTLVTSSLIASTTIVKLLAGQYVDVRCDSASKTFSGTKNNTVYITRIGNY